MWIHSGGSGGVLEQQELEEVADSDLRGWMTAEVIFGKISDALVLVLIFGVS